MTREVRAFLVLAAFLALAALGYRLLFDPEAEVALDVVAVDGDVDRIDALGQRSDLRVGTRVQTDDRIQAGADGRAVIGLGGESRVTVDANSAIRVTGMDATGVRIELEGGKVRATVRADREVRVAAGGREARIRDADAVAARGEDGVFAVSAERGAVAVSGGDGVEVVRQGERLVVAPAGAPLRSPASEDLLLHVAWPSARTRDDEVTVTGETEPGAVVYVGPPGREVQARAGADGRFSVRLRLDEGGNDVVARAVGVLGQAAEVRSQLVRDTTGPPIGVVIRP